MVLIENCTGCLKPIERDPNGLGTGYGVLTDDKGTERKVCYACCAVDDKARMTKDGRITLYLSEKGITNWPGSLVFNVMGKNVSKRGGGFGCQRADAWFIGPDGFVWHAINRGDNQIVRCKRTRDKWTRMPHGGYQAIRGRAA